jgi:hypothetical protein
MKCTITCQHRARARSLAYSRVYVLECEFASVLEGADACRPSLLVSTIITHMSTVSNSHHSSLGLFTCNVRWKTDHL